MRKSILALLSILMIGSGIVLAVSGATPTQVSQTRWGGNTAGNLTTEGGNISAVNIAGTTLTDKWASYSGNVSGRITLDSDGTGAAVYNWTWASTTGGEVCVSTNSSFAFSAATTATAAGIDTAWGFTPGDADSAANTYNLTTCNLNFSQATITGTAAADIMGFSTFNSCAVDDGGAGETNYAFCTPTQASGTGINYNNQSVNYELIVPTTTGAVATETYYFYLEL